MSSPFPKNGCGTNHKNRPKLYPFTFRKQPAVPNILFDTVITVFKVILLIDGDKRYITKDSMP